MIYTNHKIIVLDDYENREYWHDTGFYISVKKGGYLYVKPCASDEFHLVSISSDESFSGPGGHLIQCKAVRKVLRREVPERWQIIDEVIIAQEESMTVYNTNPVVSTEMEIPDGESYAIDLRNAGFGYAAVGWTATAPADTTLTIRGSNKDLVATNADFIDHAQVSEVEGPDTEGVVENAPVIWLKFTSDGGTSSVAVAALGPVLVHSSRDAIALRSDFYESQGSSQANVLTLPSPTSQSKTYTFLSRDLVNSENGYIHLSGHGASVTPSTQSANLTVFGDRSSISVTLNPEIVAGTAMALAFTATNPAGATADLMMQVVIT